MLLSELCDISTSTEILSMTKEDDSFSLVQPSLIKSFHDAIPHCQRQAVDRGVGQLDEGDTVAKKIGCHDSNVANQK